MRCSATRRESPTCPIDLSIAFGVEVGSGRSLANRLASALVAAEEAAHDGLKWKYHDPESLEDASWKLSMLSQLDERDRQGRGLGRLSAEARPRDAARSSAPKRWRAGPTPRKARSPRRSSSRQPNSTTASASSPTSCWRRRSRRPRRSTSAARVRHCGEPVGAAADATRASRFAWSALLARHGLDPQHI